MKMHTATGAKATGSIPKEATTARTSGTATKRGRCGSKA